MVKKPPLPPKHPLPDPDKLSLPLLEAANTAPKKDTDTAANTIHKAVTQEQTLETGRHLGTVYGEKKPSFRGWIHTGIFPFTIACGIILIVLAKGPVAKWASAVYMLSSMLLFGVSALYHRINWSEKTWQVFRRLDHANIFLLIAGTYTPIALLGLPLGKGTILLTLVWFGAILGIIFRVWWISAPRWLYVPLYLLLGWAAMVFIADIAKANIAGVVLVIVGGVLYTLGSLAYAFKRPNPVPAVFGFHEIFHTLTVLAFLCHWVSALLFALDPVYLR